jgi:hypothetical protein
LKSENDTFWKGGIKKAKMTYNLKRYLIEKKKRKEKCVTIREL